MNSAMTVGGTVAMANAAAVESAGHLVVVGYDEADGTSAYCVERWSAKSGMMVMVRDFGSNWRAADAWAAEGNGFVVAAAA